MPRTENTPQLHYDVTGSAGPRLLLIMGFGMQGAVWAPQLEDLSADHQVAVYDHLGIGSSDALPPGRLVQHR